LRSYGSLIRHEGNASLFTAVEISITAAAAGRPVHIHAEGVRGTGKTTIMRAAAGILPPIERIAGCEFNCRPWAPHCPDHKDLPLARIREIGTERIPMPFLEISHSAKLGTVVGSIDLARVTDRDHPSAALLLGSIPRAHRGILFVDEINRLADTSPELTDVLLDVMGTKPGRIQIEESGLRTVVLPVEISVWSASNPDEDPGPLEDVRRQLSDRFDLTVETGRSTEASHIRRILEMEEFESGTLVGADNCARENAESGWPARFIQAAGSLARVHYPNDLLELLATLYIDFDIESIRAMESLRTASRCRAALMGRPVVTISDIRAVVPMVLRHRVEVATLANILKYLDGVEDKPAHAKPAAAVGQTGLPGGNDGFGPRGDGETSAAGGPGLRGVLHKLLERMKSEQSDGPTHDGRQGGTGGAAGTCVRGNAAGFRAPSEHSVGEVCPPDPAKAITELGPKVVFGEDELS
jgi:magnesium chelatase subunit I